MAVKLIYGQVYQDGVMEPKLSVTIFWRRGVEELQNVLTLNSIAHVNAISLEGESFLLFHKNFYGAQIAEQTKKTPDFIASDRKHQTS